MVLTEQIPTRQHVAKADTWNAESVFESHDAWHKEYESLAAVAVEELSQFAGKLSSSADTLADYLAANERVSRRMLKLYFYAAMSASVDSDNEAYKIMMGQVGGLYGKVAAASSFDRPELLAMGEDALNGWVKQNARLTIYEQYLYDLLRGKQHVRSAEVEEVLGLVVDPFGEVERAATTLTNTDMSFTDAMDSDGKTYPVEQSNIGIHLQNPDREVRRTAWNHYADSYLKFKNTLSNLYVGSVKQNVFNARVRGYETALHAVLHPYNIPLDVFHNLLETCKKNLPVWHRYWDVRRRALGLKHIQPYDIWAPLTPDEPQISFEQAVDWICEGMAPLGDDYVEILRTGCLENRWVDRYPNKGKRQGAFSYGTYDTYPFIMMSFDNSLGGMSTLAHELGHSMHSYHSRKHQPWVYSSYSMFVAEVASNFNQAMTRAYLFKAKADDKAFQLALINEAMDNIHRYFFIMPTLSRFEFEAHGRTEAGKPLTADILNGIMSDLYAEGYGATMTDDRERTGITWAQFGHLYSPFYTFQYATGISAAHALANDILEGAPGAAERYRKFLTMGSSKYPIDQLREAGVDMTTPEPIEKAFKVLEGLVDRLEKLIS